MDVHILNGKTQEYTTCLDVTEIHKNRHIWTTLTKIHILNGNTQEYTYMDNLNKNTHT
jgi:hypothetical protein